MSKQLSLFASFMLLRFGKLIATRVESRLPSELFRLVPNYRPMPHNDKILFLACVLEKIPFLACVLEKDTLNMIGSSARVLSSLGYLRVNRGHSN